MTKPSPGSRLGPYELLAPLGAGGMGVVYRARDPRLDREVAIKLLPEEFFSDARRLARLEREARATAALSHPNLVAIHDIGTDGGTPYLVYELLQGESLRERLTRGPLSWREATGIARDVAAGLVAAHEKGIVHRDLKPANIFVSPSGRAKILDFGLAAFVPQGPAVSENLSAEQTLEQLTGKGAVLGTAGYMAPEQVRGQGADERSDLFALGVVLHEMLAGRAPFRRESAVESLHAILADPPGEIPATGGELPESLRHLVQRLLEKNPARRIQSSRDVLYELESLERQSAPEGAAKGPRRAAVWLSALALATVLAAGWAVRVGRRGGEAAGVPAGDPSERPIAVAALPFEMRGASPEFEFLKLGLPDEIVTELSYFRGFAVRSFTQSSRFSAAAGDLDGAANELGASHLVVGQFGLEGEQIRVSVEAVDIGANQIIWRDSWGAAKEGLLGLRDEMREKVARGLVVALGRENASRQEARRGPGNAEAYDLFLRASALPLEADSNQRAIEMLERSVALDPGFALAFLELAQRLHYGSLILEGADPEGARLADQYVQRALELDPNLLEAQLTRLRREVEQGHLADAFRGAVDLVRRRPENAPARVILAYVLRYGGALRESIRECEEARRLDPAGTDWVRCQWTYAQGAQYERALEAVDLMSEGWDDLRRSLRADMLTRAGERQAALAEISQASEDVAAQDIQRDCLLEVKPRDLGERIAQRRAAYASWPDPEALYWYGALLADCGFTEESLYFLRLSIDHSYCAAAGLDNDPMWDPIRDEPGFVAQRARSMACHERFMAERGG